MLAGPYPCHPCNPWFIPFGCGFAALRFLEFFAVHFSFRDEWTFRGPTDSLTLGHAQPSEPTGAPLESYFEHRRPPAQLDVGRSMFGVRCFRSGSAGLG